MGFCKSYNNRVALLDYLITWLLDYLIGWLDDWMIGWLDDWMLFLPLLKDDMGYST